MRSAVHFAARLKLDLTVQKCESKSNEPVAMNAPSNLYAIWRGRHLAGTFHDGDAPPPERLMQAIWQHQRLRRDDLRTSDGRALRVLHPGFWNREAGPDFRGAVLQFDEEPPVSGDVELDVAAPAWRGHGHARNPAFAHVRLHVVWEAPPPETAAPAPPVLGLRPFLDASPAELRAQLGGESGGALPAALRGKCSAPLRDLDDASLATLLHQAAVIRLETKAAHLAARARHTGWEQALWEGLFAALGYKHNVWPLRRLAELLPALREAGPRDLSPLAWQARLFGVGGLLPAELARRAGAAADYLRRLWDIWWRERERWTGVTLPRAVWRFHGLRPHNHPQRRLALAAHWLARGDLPARLEKWLAQTAPKAAPPAFTKALLVTGDEFWSRHLTFNSPRSARPQALLGEARAGDLAVNVILPWFHARATAGGNDSIRRAVLDRYCAWPAGEDNAVLKLARQRLLGARAATRLRTAAAQQGLLQIVRDFCEQSDAVCAACPFPELVKCWPHI
jgi:hypothetical protein